MIRQPDLYAVYDPAASPGARNSIAIRIRRAASISTRSRSTSALEGRALQNMYAQRTVSGEAPVQRWPDPWSTVDIGRWVEKVVMARPTGFKRADAIYIPIPIQGAGNGLMAARA
jgi:hypothetical protein